MKNEEKTKEQLADELIQIRRKAGDLEASYTDCKRSEKVLRESRERLTALFEFAPDAYYLTDMSGNFVDCNRAAEEITGYKKNELIGKNFLTSRLLPSEQIQKAAEFLAKSELWKPSGPEVFNLKRKDGTFVSVEISTSPAKIKDQGVILGIARDITVRCRADEALQRLRQKLEDRLEERTAAVTNANELLNHEISERKRAQEELNGILEELEGRVEERTAELSIANELLNRELSERKEAEEVLRKANEELEGRLKDQTTELSNTDRLLRQERDERKKAEESLGKTREELETRLKDHAAELSDTRELLNGERAERAQSGESLQAVLAAIEEGYYEVDISGNLTFFNDSFRKIWGYSRNELQGMNNREYMDEEQGKKIYETFNQVYANGGPAREFEAQIERKDGTKRHIEASVSLMKDAKGNPSGFRGAVRDITERSQLESQKDYLQNILESSPDCITTTDLDGMAIYASSKVTKILGYEKKELVGEKIHVLYDNGGNDAEKIMEEISEKGEIEDREIKLKKKDGTYVDVQLSALSLKNGRGDDVGFLWTYRDVSEKKKQEVLLQQAEKMEAIGTLAGGIAHDFNNLLMGVQGNASLVLLDINSSHPHYEKIKNIEEHVQSAADLTKQLLGFAGGGRYDVRTTDLNDLIKDTSETFAQGKKGIKIHRKYQEDLWAVEADQDQIEQVLVNLYENARHAMPNGGDLFLETENVILDERYYIDAYGIEPGRYVKMSITDTGIGMDEAIKQRIFEPFFTTKEMGRGAGLGLAFVYGIIRNHGGLINVQSEKEKGSTFNIYLPISKDVVPHP